MQSRDGDKIFELERPLWAYSGRYGYENGQELSSPGLQVEMAFPLEGREGWGNY